MAKKKDRDCLECMGYCNMLDDDDYSCGLGFEISEEAEGGYGTWSVAVRPLDNKCEVIELPKTKEEFVRTAASLGIEWDIEDVLTVEEYDAAIW